MDDDTPATEPAPFEPVVDGGDLPKFDPPFELVTWDTPDGPVVGVDYTGETLPTPAERIAAVERAMTGDINRS